MQSEVVKPADCTGLGQTGLIGSRQSDSLSRSVLSIQSKRAHRTKITETSQDFDSVKSIHCNRSSDATKISNLAANDVATFSLAFDDFLNSEEEDDIDEQVAEYTRLKAPNGGFSATAKPASDSLDVVSSRQVTETCTSVCVIMSGRPGLIGSGQHSSERGSKTTMSVTTLPQIDCTTRSGHCALTGLQRSSSVTGSGQHELTGSTVPQLNCTARSGQCEVTGSQRSSFVTGSGQCELTGSTVPHSNCTARSGQCEVTGSQRPSSVTSSAQSEAERSREERIRLSRLKREEFQRRFATTLPSKQPEMSSLSVDTSIANDRPQTSSSSVDTSKVNDVVDHQQTKLCVLVDSRELSSAQVSYYQWLCKSLGSLFAHTTDLFIYILDVVPPVDIVSNHVATDKHTTANGGTFTSSSASLNSQSL